MKIKDAVVLVTGANRGLGLALSERLLELGARKIYAAVRDTSSVKLAGVVPVQLDVTNEADIKAAVERLTDVSIVINNAGIDLGAGVTSPQAVQSAREELEVNLFAPLIMSQKFAPVLAKNGGGVVVNILSVLSWLNMPPHGTYCISKAAAWSMTNGLRNELAAQGTHVVGVHVGYMETDMTSHVTAEKVSPRNVAKTILEAVESGQDEVLADGTAQYVKAHLSDARGIYLGQARS